ncbi:MAG TPA: endopeptidase La [Candidatus Krumholzibacteria bacterium]|nr:endopeptidase La [Candidatus Krumholzibacteria bacterium]
MPEDKSTKERSRSSGSRRAPRSEAAAEAPPAARENVLTLPVLPIKNTVVFPSIIMPLSVGRPMSVAAVEAAVGTEEKEILVITQRDATIDEPKQEDLFTIGTRSIIKKLPRPHDEALQVIVQGVERVVLIKLERVGDLLQARVRPAPVPEEKSVEIEALRREVYELATRANELSRPQLTSEFEKMLSESDEPMRLVYLLGSIITLELEKEQSLLEATSCSDALRLMYAYLRHEVQVLELRNKIASEAQSEMSRQQREYLLRQQLRAIQQELGEDPESTEVEMLRQRLEEAQVPEEVRKEIDKELKRLEKVPSVSPEHHVIRSYVELVLELPWTRTTEDRIDIPHSRQVLDEDHYDLKEVKERILEQLGVLKLNPEAKAPILCFVGPPGVGKTSLGQSIARSMGRKFERMSLGGMHDEAELRGHRRTYIGAMPGRILQAIRRAGVKNPLLMLDEVDKLGRDFRGDPAAALLEVLDPEQNKSFRDNYLDLAFDLSKVFFITTANTLDTIPRPLLDRMEVLRLPGYSEEEKTEIAKRYLIPRQLREAGLNDEKLVISPATLQTIISRYTREAGVRQLERTIGRVARKAALHFAEGKIEPVRVEPQDLPDMLGPEIFSIEKMRRESPPGVATGLAWTETGGEVLYIESSLLPDANGLTLTGHLGEVMKESAKAAQSWVWAHADELGFDRKILKESGVHIHVPAGAIPKDGPSAGVAIVTALASLYSGKPARSDTAMTGEITLAGLVLPIGGIKEKVLAARRAGIRRVVLPRENEKDLRDLPPHVRQEMQFTFVERITELLAASLPSLTPTTASTRSPSTRPRPAAAASPPE